MPGQVGEWLTDEAVLLTCVVSMLGWLLLLITPALS